MTDDQHSPAGDTAVHQAAASGAGESHWKRRIILILVGLVVLVLLYFFSVSFLPRWWAQRVSGIAGGTFSKGIMAGLVIGAIFTLLPLIVIRQAFRKSWKWPARIAALIVGLLLAAPNLVTLGIVLGNGDAAHAGERTLDTDAPGFRGATLAGVLIAVALFVLGQWLLFSRRRNRRKVKDLKARVASDEQLRQQEQERLQAPPGPAPEQEYTAQGYTAPTYVDPNQAPPGR